MVKTHDLDEAIKRKGLKKAYLAGQLDVTDVSFCNKMHNRQKFKAPEIVMLSVILGLNNEEVQNIFLLPRLGKTHTRRFRWHEDI